MTTINDKLTYLAGTKDAIKQAIIGKGVEVTDTDTFRSYADKIEAIQSGGSIAGAPSGMKLGYSTFTTVPDFIIPYLETETNMSNMFRYCSSLQTVPEFDASKVNNMNGMFFSCVALTTVSFFKTSNVINMESMFNNCISLTTVSFFKTSNVINMESMFNNCISLTTASFFKTSNVINMESMFSDCISLTTVPQFDTNKVNNMNTIFYNCEKLQTVPLLNVSNVTTMDYPFDSCSSLTNLGGFTGLKIDLDLSSSSKLTVDSVMNVINNAADMTSSPKTLTLHKDTFDKLSQEQIATATAKGWNIAHW